MKRRTFLKGAAGVGAGAMSFGVLSGGGCAAGAGRGRAYAGHAGKVKTLKRLENEFVSLVLYSNASMDLLDKKIQTRWRMGTVALQESGPIDEGHVWLRTSRSICEQYPGRFSGRKTGESVLFALLGRQNKLMGTFVLDVRLDGEWLEFVISDIDERLPSLIFPPAIESDSLVFPSKLGRWIRKPTQGRYFWTFFSNLNMRWFGGLKGKAGWMAVFTKQFADAGVSHTEMSASPGWLKSLGRWRYPRTIRYRFTQDGYVGMAQAFRAWAIENGLHKSLEEKTAQVPAVGNLSGGRFFSIVQACPPVGRRYFKDRLKPYNEKMLRARPVSNISHRQAAAIIKEAQQLGMNNGLALLRGWINGGYDFSHPDVWPPEPALGGIDELRELCTTAGSVVVALHDNYQDIYEHCASFPKGIIRLANDSPLRGQLMPGGYWAGGQAYIINSRDSIKYAKRNWEKIKTLQPTAMFVDTTTVVQAYESYEKANTLTRSQDIEYKQKLLKFFKDQKVVLGSEGGSDFGMAYTDFFENWHQRTAGESIPLWPIVYGDSAFCARLRDNNFCITMNYPQTPWPWWLEDMLWGYMPYFGIDCAREWNKRKAEFKSTLHVDNWHGRVGGRQMVDHRFLTDDFAVEQTTFANGLSIIANFDKAERLVEGVSVPGYGYVIRD